MSFAAVAWIACGAAAFFVVQSEQQLAARRAAMRAFDLHAREAADVLADLRTAQQAYVAEGQSVAFWIAKVKTLRERAAAAVDALRGSAAGAAAQKELGDAAASLDDFGSADTRAREYVASRETLMAADVVFTEGGAAAVAAARRIESSRLAERQALDAAEAAVRRLEALAIGGAAGLSALFLAILGIAGGSTRGSEAAQGASPSSGLDLSLSGHDLQAPAASAVQPTAPAAPAFPIAEGHPVESDRGDRVSAAAGLCTEFARASQLADLQKLLGRIAEMIDARGVVVWLGSAAGSDLRPVLTHGYAAQAVARMPPVPRSADNAVAAAYRTGARRVVAGTTDATGAIVAPLMAPDGCVGALTIEMNGGESSVETQAIATIFAAQLAGVLSSSAAGGEQAVAATR